MGLQEEIDQKAKEIHTDSYTMSIGELMSIYESEEIDIHPEFQRVFQWSDDQKSTFIESILLGIPIPPIFVAQGEDGIWDVIDGVQRLSTIYEFTGLFKDDEGIQVAPSTMTQTSLLPSLEGKVWEGESENAFTKEQRINFKREKLDIKIIKKASDPDAKYELFQRLNTGGKKLSPQESRDCLIIMEDKPFFYKIKRLADHGAFQECVPLSDRLKDQKFDVELVTRFIVYRSDEIKAIQGNENVEKFLDKSILNIIHHSKGLGSEVEAFKKTFDFLNRTLGEKSFQKYYADSERFKGGFKLGPYEAIIVGLSENIDDYIANYDETTFEHKIVEMYKSENYKTIMGKNLRPIARMKQLIANSRDFFHHED
ncbi:DUF262 domain-containing protein [Aureibacillus halotolerans]|uniref:Uncharacterized protein DUF262 n=1 Tax=Aureibacillus halotolerans TaxID=1508390 RepID=A0A4R6TVB6_9BACI|nr:DUF262 domain-containing protein [Aureibacillus halotolerans]TDQ37136.1 uncharacterized protein DUF262 [Aureibacillus halotolerans]